jgi:hypothetical protein
MLKYAYRFTYMVDGKEYQDYLESRIPLDDIALKKKIKRLYKLEGEIKIIKKRLVLNS